jgi:hypothetical protein
MWVDIVDSVLFTIIYPVTLFIAVAIGLAIAQRTHTLKNRQWQSSGVEGSVIGIFALLLSFTFAASHNSMKDRMNLLHGTTDAVANFRRETLFLDNDIKEATKQYLVKYLDILGNFREHYIAGEKKLIERVETVNGDYLTFLTARGKLNADAKQQIHLLLPYFNQLNGYFYRIVFSYDERTPHLIIILLIVSSWLIGLLVGFVNGIYEKIKVLVPLIFLVLVSLCVQAIRDLDNPNSGTIRPEFADFIKQENSLMNSTR